MREIVLPDGIAPPAPGGIILSRTITAGSDAQAIVTAATAEAERLVAAAHEQADAVRAAARAAGEQDGYRQATAQVAACLAALEQARAVHSETIAELALMLAERIVGALPKDRLRPRLVRKAAHSLQGRLDPDQRATLRVPPDVLAAEQAHLVAVLRKAGLAGVTIRVDAGLEDDSMALDCGTLTMPISTMRQLRALADALHHGQAAGASGGGDD